MARRGRPYKSMSDVYEILFSLSLLFHVLIPLINLLGAARPPRNLIMVIFKLLVGAFFLFLLLLFKSHSICSGLAVMGCKYGVYAHTTNLRWVIINDYVMIIVLRAWPSFLLTNVARVVLARFRFA